MALREAMLQLLQEHAPEDPDEMRRLLGRNRTPMFSLLASLFARSSLASKITIRNAFLKKLSL